MGSLGKSILPASEALLGAGSELFAPGNPVGTGLLASGGGQLAGGSLGGQQGQQIGGTLGGLAGMGLGGLGGSLTGGGGFSGAMANMNPMSPGFNTGAALSANPALRGITPDMIQAGGSSMPPAPAAQGMAASSPLLKGTLDATNQLEKETQPAAQPRPATPQAPKIPGTGGKTVPYTPSGGQMPTNPTPMDALAAYHQFLSSVG